MRRRKRKRRRARRGRKRMMRRPRKGHQSFEMISLMNRRKSDSTEDTVSVAEMSKIVHVESNEKILSLSWRKVKSSVPGVMDKKKDFKTFSDYQKLKWESNLKRLATQLGEAGRGKVTDDVNNR